MHRIKFHKTSAAPIPMVNDGKKVIYRDQLKIDQFFGSDGCLKITGFPASDVSLFERLARSGSSLDSLTTRISPTSPNPVDKRSDREKLDTVRPAWCQTAAEVARYEESMYQRSERKKSSEQLADQPVSQPTEQLSDQPVTE